MVTTGCGGRALRRVLLSGWEETVFSSLLLWRLWLAAPGFSELSWSSCHLSPEMTISWASCSCRGMRIAHSGSSCSAIVVEKVSFRKFVTYTDSCQGWTWVVWLRNLIPWIGCLIQDNKYETVRNVSTVAEDGGCLFLKPWTPRFALWKTLWYSLGLWMWWWGVIVLREDCRLLSKLHVKCAMCSSSLQMKTEPCTLNCSVPWSVMLLFQLFRRLKQYGLVSLSAQAACIAWWNFVPKHKSNTRCSILHP